MEITGWTIYWITRLDGMKIAFAVTAIAGAIAAFILFMDRGITNQVYADSADRPWAKRELDRVAGHLGVARRLVLATALAVVGLVATPTTKEMCAVLVIPAVANSENVQVLGGDIATLAREWAEELGPSEVGQ